MVASAGAQLVHYKVGKELAFLPAIEPDGDNLIPIVICERHDAAGAEVGVANPHVQHVARQWAPPGWPGLLASFQVGPVHPKVGPWLEIPACVNAPLNFLEAGARPAQHFQELDLFLGCLIGLGHLAHGPSQA